MEGFSQRGSRAATPTACDGVAVQLPPQQFARQPRCRLNMEYATPLMDVFCPPVRERTVGPFSTSYPTQRALVSRTKEVSL